MLDLSKKNRFQAPDYENGNLVNLMHSILAGMQPKMDGLYPTSLLAPDKLRQTNNVVLLLLDGLGYHYISERNTDGFFNRQLVGPLNTVFPTTTASAITTVMTGLSPKAHGITGWFMYFKEIGSVIAALPFRLRLGNETMPATVTAESLYQYRGLLDGIDADRYIVTPQHLAHSAYSKAMGGTAQRLGYADLDDFMEKLGGLLSQPQRKFVYAYWPEFDALAHIHGVNSDTVRVHYNLLQQTLERFCDSNMGTDTALIVTADHGFVDTAKEKVIDLSQHPTLAQCLALPLCGEPRTAYCYLRPRHVQLFENYVTNELHESVSVCESAALLDQGYFGLDNQHENFQDRIGDYTLLMHENFVINHRLMEEPPFSMIGVHGGLSREEKNIPLIFQKL